MKTILFLVRHGETVDNANNIMQGQTQGQLNDVGVRQAWQLRDELAERHFDAVVASDLKRAVDTTDLLRERDWGSFTGRYIPDLKGEVWPDDIESLDDLLARAGRFLDYVRTHYAGKTVLAVGHGIVNKAIQAVYYGKQMRDVERMANCEVRILEL